VHVLDADPTASKPKAGNYQLAAGAAAAKSKVKVDGDPSGTAFNLEAKKVGAGGDNIKVTISNVDGTAETFTLVAVWSSQPITAIKAATAKAQLEQNKYEIEVTPSASNTPPVAGVVTLTGGAAAKAASAATATVYSG
jgi:phage tail sheath gpL-like